MSMIDLEAYLSGKGSQVKRSGSQIHTHCFFCNEDSSGRGRLYFDDSSDETRGLYNCFLCGERGNIHTLRKYFGDPPLDDGRSVNVDRTRRIMDAACEFYRQQLTPEHRSWLKTSRGFTDETIDRFKFGSATSSGLGAHLHSLGFSLDEMVSTGLVRADKQDFLTNCITFPYLIAGTTVQIRGKQVGAKYLTPPGQPARMFNTDAVWGSQEVIITEGEFDAIALTQLGFNAVAVPGAASWADTWTAYFEDATRVFIMYDPDEVGQKGRLKVEEALGARAKNVVLPVPDGEAPKVVDPNWLLANLHWGTQDFKNVLEDSVWANSLLLSPRDAFAEWETVQGVDGFKLGFEILDNLLKPGLLPGQVMVPLAKTNCLSGSTELIINRAGNGRRIRLDTLVAKFHGRNDGKKWDLSIPTMIQHVAPDGTIRLTPIRDAFRSGMRETFTLITEGGRRIQATAKHRFMTNDGWKQLGELSPGDLVLVNAGRTSSGAQKTPPYRQVHGLTFHPYRTRQAWKDKGWSSGDSVQEHRVVMEAHLSGVSVDDFVARCKSGDIGELTFIDPKVQTVHHIDHDRQNNALPNLELKDRLEHWREHDFSSNVLERVDYDVVEYIEFKGMEETYDISVDHPHNFVANEFVVHNSGKSIILLNFAQRATMLQPDAKILLVSLEQTRGDWFERARRIWNFYNLEADPGDVNRKTLEYWDERIRLVDKNRVRPEELETTLVEYEEQMGKKPDLVMVDYLGYWARSFKGRDRYEQVADAIMELKAIAKDFRIPIIAPHQVNRSAEFGEEFSIDQARDSGVIEETADFALSLWNADSLKGREDENRTGTLNLAIGKSRHGGKGQKVKLQFGYMTLTIMEHSDKFAQMARREVDWVLDSRLDWRDAIAAHRTGTTPKVVTSRGLR